MNISNVTILVTVIAAVFVIIPFVLELLPERLICIAILKKWKITGRVPQATIKRAVNFDKTGCVEYRYEQYRAMSCFYDDVVSIEVSFLNRRVCLETFESFLAEHNMAYAPKEKGAVIIAV